MALDARRFAHLARDDHGLARYRSTAGQLPSHISVTRVLLREAHERIVVLGWDSHLLEVASRKEAQHLQVPNLLLEKHRSVPAEADRL